MEDVDKFESPEGVGVVEKVENVEKKKGNPFKFVLMFLLFLFVGIVGFGVYEYFRIKPNDVRFTNVTSSSVTVSWNTKSPTSASALVFEGDTLLPLTILGLGGERFYDTRDVRVAELRAVQETSTNLFNDEELGVSMEDISTEIEVVNMGEYYTHHVTITGLDSEKEYSFMIGDSFLYTKANDVDGASTVETLAVPNSVEAPIPAYGSIKDAQNSEDPEMLAPVYDGIVYFNLMDELSGNRSNVYSGALNEDGNWYIDISGIRVEEGEDFLSGEVIANVVGEIAIDAGPKGKWEGVLNSDIIAPAEMIVINDPLQGEFDGAGIKKVESNVLGDFTFDTEAASCLFAGYCGPCYEGVLTNPCTCPQSTLDARPGCKGQEDGTTMEQAIAAVASASSKCSGGDPGEYVYFGECKQCLKYIDQSGVDRGYRWQTAKDQSKCDDNKSGTAFSSGDGDPGGPLEDSSCVTTPQSELKEGSKCCRDGIWGIGKQFSVDRCPDGDCDAYGLSLYCDISGNRGSVKNTLQRKVGDPCDVSNGSGKWITREVDEVVVWKCTAIDCDQEDGYVRRFDSNLKKDVCVKETDSTVGIVNCGDSSNLGEICALRTTSTEIIYSHCTAGGLCKEDGESCGSDSVAKVRKAWLRGVCTNTTVCTEDNLVYNPTTESCTAGSTEVTLQEEESLKIAQECYETGWGTRLNLVLDGQTYKCVNGELVSVEVKPNKGNSASACKDFSEEKEYFCTAGDYCYLESTGKLYYCYGSLGDNLFKPVVPGAKHVKAAYQPSRAYGCGRPCDNYNGCLCGSDYIQEGVWCSCVRPLGCNDSTEGRTCKNSTTRYSCQSGRCLPAPDGDVEGVYDESNSVNLLENLVLGVEASNEYVLDRQTGMLVGVSEGLYAFEYEGQLYLFDVNKGEEEVLIYIDQNGNNEYDEGVDVKVSEIASTLNIVALSKKFAYELEEGFNFVSFPFIVQDEELRTAASLLKKLNEIYGNSLFSISKYEGGRWKIVGQNTVLYGNNDFQLLPGEGYVIKAKEEITVSVIGQPVKYDTVADSAPITLFEGWNLIGLYGTGVKTYTAKTMIADINASNFTADNVSKWEKEKQSYTGFQFSEGQEYGFDFPINPLESVFVRILEGRGNWQPKLRSQ